MANIHNSVEKTFREELEPNIRASLAAVDPVYRDVILTSQRVEKNKGLGRGHKIIRVFTTGTAGGAKFAGVSGGNVLSTPVNFTMYDTPLSFQGLGDTAYPAYYNAEVSLIQQAGNFFIPRQLLRTDEYNSSIGSVVAQILEQVGVLAAQHEAAQWYSDNSAKALADIGTKASSCANGADGQSVVVTLKGNNTSGRAQRFLEGMLVDIWNSAGSTQVNPNYLLVIDTCDPLENKITIRRVDGGSFSTTDLTNDDIIVIKDSLSQGPVNMNDYIKSSGTLFTGIALADRARHKSLVVAESGGLTEMMLNKRYYQIYEGYPDLWLEKAITTNGVLMGFLDNLDAAIAGGVDGSSVSRFDRNGEALDVEAGFSGFKYRFAGRPVTIHTSQFVEEGYWYGLKLRNGNLRRYVPPGLPNAGKNSQIHSELEFVAPTMGSKSIFLPATDAAGRITDFMQAPFTREWNMMPEDFRSLKITGISPISVS